MKAKDEIMETVETFSSENTKVKEIDFTSEFSKNDIANDVKESFAEEILALSENFALKDIFESIKLTDYFQNDTDECLEKNCDNPDTTLGFCRFHYIKNWSDIKKKQSILVEGKLQDFIDDIVSKYPIKYLELILNDLTDEKAFFGSLKELDIESTGDSFDDVEDVIEDEQDIAFETKGLISKEIEDT